MKFLNSVQSEALKTKGSAVVWVSIAGSLMLPVIYLIRYLVIDQHINQWVEAENSWIPLFFTIAKPFTGFFLPFGAILVCSLITQVEYRNNNWKQVHTTPQSYARIFFSKYTVLLLITLLVYTFLNIGILLLGVIPCLALDGKLPDDTVPFLFFLKESGKSFITILPVLGLQYLLSLRFKNFLVSMGIGCIAYIGTMVGLQTDYAYISPFSQALMYFEPRLIRAHVNIYLLASLYFAGFTLVNYILYYTQKQKG